MQIVQNLELAGYYRLEKIRNGRRELVADWFPNIITNNGLDLFATGYTQKFQAVYVGTGSSTPTANDTQLENQIATTSGASISSGIDTTGRYVYMNAQYTFAAGAAAGNISEIGVGPTGGNNLFSRALVVDLMGNPTTITVLSDEQLIVTYQLRLYQPTGDFTFSVDGYSITCRAANANSTQVNGWAALTENVVLAGNLNAHSAHAGDIVAITSAPSGQSNPSSVSTDAYVPGSYQVAGTITFGTGDANFNIKSFSYSLMAGGAWQFSVDPVIPKTSDDQLTISVGVRWARYGEL